ncbi:MAG: bacteriocin fulvocin C-related protein [Acidobacteriota bacterium]|nr:bacteriocin fulvocin C-related protein [Acidobacteriota bacterium]
MKRIGKVFLLLLVAEIIAVSSTIIVNAQKAVSSDPNPLPATKVVEDNSIQNYKKISSLPEEKRRDFFIAASAAQKAGLWRIHLALAVTKHPTLNKDQRAILMEIAPLLTNESFEKPSDNNSSKTALLQSIFQRSVAVFPRAFVAETFFRLGGSVEDIKLLEDFQSVSALLPSRKKAAFGDFSYKAQSDLWRLHLGMNLFYRSGSLNPAQKTIIFDLIEFAGPEIYEVVKIEPIRKTRIDEPMKAFAQRISGAFSSRQEEAEEIFFTLGSKAWKGDNPEVPEDLDDSGRLCQCSSILSMCGLFNSSCSGDNCYINPFCGIIYLMICDGVKCVAN